MPPKKKTLLLIFIHGFKGTDRTFHSFPRDLQHALAAQLPGLDILTLLFPQYETRGDLRDCVARFKEWLQNKVIDLEVANGTPSPTVEPSVHVVLVGHSMGGIVAVEALMSVVRDAVVPPMSSSGGGGYANDTTNATTRPKSSHGAGRKAAHLDVPEPAREERASSAPPPKEEEHSRLFFPYIQAVLAFDTPFLGISPGVLAHGAEEQINHASSAYKAYDTASNFFGWGGTKGAATQANASAGALPAANGSTSGWGKWGKYAAFAGAAAGIAGAAGAAYLNWDQINQGLAWAGSHLEFVGCLARGAELQRRVESVVELERTHGVGFANFYGTLGSKVTSQTKYAGAVLGADRTFCVVPRSASSRSPDSPTGTKRDAPASSAQQNPPSKRRKDGAAVRDGDDRTEGEQVQDFAQDTSKSKGQWVKCVNEDAGDELRAHTSMFAPARNPDYGDMVPRARDQILGWIGRDGWSEEVGGGVEVEEEGEQTGASDGLMEEELRAI